MRDQEQQIAWDREPALYRSVYSSSKKVYGKIPVAGASELKHPHAGMTRETSPVSQTVSFFLRANHLTRRDRSVAARTFNTIPSENHRVILASSGLSDGCSRHSRDEDVCRWENGRQKNQRWLRRPAKSAQSCFVGHFLHISGLLSPIPSDNLKDCEKRSFIRLKIVVAAEMLMFHHF
jgi:hypothetical protein